MTVLPTEMNVVEENYGFPSDITYVREPGYTHRLDTDKNVVAGFVDGKEAFRQAVYKLLNTERYDHVIYSTDYGVELRALIGMPIYYVVPEIERRVTEAIMQDDRTVNVYGFKFDTTKRGVVSVTFNVMSIYGEIEVEKDVEM